MLYTPAQLRQINNSYRGRGAVGPNAKVPKFVHNFLKHSGLPHWESVSILDYGAGPLALHSQWLREQGHLAVTAIDIGKNFNENVHNMYAHKSKYGLVFASNVLNIQPTHATLVDTVAELARLSNRWVVVNYPLPRKLSMPIYDVHEMLLRHFAVVDKTEGDIFVCHKKQ